MTHMPAVIEPSLEFGLETYEQAKAFHANLVWQKLDDFVKDHFSCEILGSFTFF